MASANNAGWKFTAPAQGQGSLWQDVADTQNVDASYVYFTPATATSATNTLDLQFAPNGPSIAGAVDHIDVTTRVKLGCASETMSLAAVTRARTDTRSSCRCCG